MRVRLVTWDRALPDGDYDSVPLLGALRRRNVSAEIRSWTDRTVDWSDAYITVIRSTWDYHERLDAFLDWARRTASVTALFNPPDLLRWNTDKRYLLDLERAGVDVVPTVAIERAETTSIASAVRQYGWSDVVLKPAVSLDGHGVHRFTAGSDSMSLAIDALADAGPVILQPFMQRIVRDGEVSLAFIAGAFSHAVRKRPAHGDFRVQERLGGSVEAAEPPAGSTVFGQRVLATLPVVPLYARIDLIGSDDAPFLLTELELVEPSLFLATDPEAADRFAAAIERLLSA